MGGSASYSGYYQDSTATGFPTTAIPQNAMSYHHATTDYGQPDARQTQNFSGTYNPNLAMYGVAQAAGSQGGAVYDTSQQFPSRQMGIIPTDASSYFTSEPTNPSAASTLQAQAASSSTGQVYPQTNLQGYQAGGMAAMGGMAAQATSTPADVRMEEEYPSSGGLDQAYTSYQSALKEIFQNIRNGVLATASESLLSVSDWLLSHVADLGKFK